MFCANSSEGTIVTDLVYPLLLRSNLPREVLGYIWELCNKTTPGLLIREELFLILAMISVAQVGCCINLHCTDSCNLR
jgi:hypothetical protein